MRAIEKQIIGCLSGSANCGKSKGLSLRDSAALEKDTERVYLWGHCIFTLGKENNIKFSFQGWQASAAKARIDALLLAFSSCPAGICQKNYQLAFLLPPGNFLLIQIKSMPLKTGSPKK